MTLQQFLEHKPLFYEVIDTTRMPLAYQSVKEHFELPPIVHIVGTNGKGTTGRFLAQMLHSCGLHVGHYTSPHIEKFNERMWIDGYDIDDEILEFYHQKLFSKLSPIFQETLSYFEYTTLLAMLCFCDKCDFVVLEAGLGGEFDATNVFEKVLSIITPIGIDHQAFLGESIGEIAQTKINSVINDFILAKQYEKEVYSIARKKASKIGRKLFEAESFFDIPTCKKIASFVSKQGYSTFLKDNFTTAFCALRVLGYDNALDTFQPLSLRG
ncbi:MAG: bifunctional folylpolyglutamate synthase/dihydrofolate synthase, partial [Sulfurimonas sp. RIFOXYB2_FULL_37_5]